MTSPTYILRGIAGSHAHGLATPLSDEDFHGVYSWPTANFWNLTAPAETLTGHEPYDYSYHELEKFLRLCSKCNPTVLEILGLGEYLEKEPYWGDRLILIRDAFFSERYVKNSFIGYAESQFRKLVQRGDSFDSSVRKRTNKHARHLFRLMETGKRLYETGILQVRVDDPDSYLKYNSMTVDQISDEFMDTWDEFNLAKSVLPEQPDFDRINEYLFDYRASH
jgi:uncharacterized protein